MSTTQVYKTKTNIVKTLTNSGLPVKHLVCMMQGVKIYKYPTVHIIKYILVDRTDVQALTDFRSLGYAMVKRFKDKYLYRQVFAARAETFHELIKALDSDYIRKP